jgi:hypothetical protein
MKMKILLNVKSKYCDINDLFYINSLVKNNVKKKNVAIVAYFKNRAISFIDVDYSINISLVLNNYNEEVFDIYVRETNTSIYCTRLEVIKREV